ncbi:hypothetical protein [Streptomyces sp. bgisy159]|uniref:hypothetical protein n=1 Tax=Streptomyces sp. bgisy159 TaxID=3413795 RepID=UPI003F4A7217
MHFGERAGGGGVVAGVAGRVGDADPLDLREGAVEGVVGELLAAGGGVRRARLGRGGDPRPAGEREPLGGGDLRDRGGAAAELTGDLVTGLSLGVQAANCRSVAVTDRLRQDGSPPRQYSRARNFAGILIG